MTGAKIAQYMGKRKDNGEWITGYYVDGMICEAAEDTSNATGEYYGQTPYAGFVDVEDETVCQYIGRKDKNHNRIFEGHILDTGACTGIVEWQESSCRFVLIHNSGKIIPMEDIHENACEIIGHVLS